MREILFRGKAKDTGEWVYGDLSFHKDGTPFIRYWEGTGDNLHYRSTEVEKNTVGQFTGITDDDDQCIFEGDIVKATLYPECSVYGYVEWSQKDCCFRVRLSKNNSTGVHESDIVVGDIHCDPEFVKRMMTE